jgi:hypothetical protein
MIKSIVKSFVQNSTKILEKITYMDNSIAEIIHDVATNVPESVSFIDKNGNREESF